MGSGWRHHWYSFTILHGATTQKAMDYKIILFNHLKDFCAKIQTKMLRPVSDSDSADFVEIE
jgi:hypothetical protein